MTYRSSLRHTRFDITSRRDAQLGMWRLAVTRWTCNCIVPTIIQSKRVCLDSLCRVLVLEWKSYSQVSLRRYPYAKVESVDNTLCERLICLPLSEHTLAGLGGFQVEMNAKDGSCSPINLHILCVNKRSRSVSRSFCNSVTWYRNPKTIILLKCSTYRLAFELYLVVFVFLMSGSAHNPVKHLDVSCVLLSVGSFAGMPNF